MLLLGPFVWGFALLLSMNATYRKLKTPKILHVSDIRTFESILASSSPPKLSRIRVAGNFSKIADDHPVVEAVMSRWKANSKPGQRAYGDVNKIALSIEGGGMRGCVSAGATAALNILGIHDTIDVVYGSSAGAMIGAYFISRQFSGVQIYHDILPSAGKRFIDKGKLLFAAGLPGWLNFFLRRKSGTIDEIMSFIPDPEALGSRLSSKKSGHHESLTNVINLDFLLVQVMGILQPLDWNIFTKNEAAQPLKIVASSLKTMAPVVMSREKGNYGDLSSLLQCIRASMAVPGITGGMMAISETEKKSLPSNGHSCSVPFKVQKRSKVHHSYQVAKIGIDESIPQKEVQLTGIMKTKIVQEAIVVARAAIVLLLKWITLLRGKTDLRSAVGVNSNYVASEMYGERGVRDLTPKSFEKSTDSINSKEIKNTPDKERSVEDCEPLVDAFLCEPLPYRSAVLDGASHVIVLRTRPDPCPVLGKGPGVFEKLIAKR
jgi:predicted acylesterase/phospholipase RssA